MKEAGIDTAVYGPYSTRAASASKAAASNLHINDIMKTAGWSRQSTFARFYNKEIVNKDTYSDVILTL